MNNLKNEKMKKVIEKNGINRLLYELLKLKKTDKYLREWGKWPNEFVRLEKIVMVYATLIPWVRAVGLYNKSGGSSMEPFYFYWERTEDEAFAEKNDVASKRFKECIKRNKPLFYEITAEFSEAERKDFINILFALFPVNLGAIWPKDGKTVLINEMSIREIEPLSIKESRIFQKFNVEIKGEDKLKAQFKKEDRRRKQKRDQTNVVKGHDSRMSVAYFIH